MASKKNILEQAAITHYHWCVKRYKIEDVDVLEQHLGMYDELGWEIFDVDIVAGTAFITMRAPRSAPRPAESLGIPLIIDE